MFHEVRHVLPIQFKDLIRLLGPEKRRAEAIAFFYNILHFRKHIYSQKVLQSLWYSRELVFVLALGHSHHHLHELEAKQVILETYLPVGMTLVDLRGCCETWLNELFLLGVVEAVDQVPELYRAHVGVVAGECGIVGVDLLQGTHVLADERSDLVKMPSLDELLSFPILQVMTASLLKLLWSVFLPVAEHREVPVKRSVHGADPESLHVDRNVLDPEWSNV